MNIKIDKLQKNKILLHFNYKTPARIMFFKGKIFGLINIYHPTNSAIISKNMKLDLKNRSLQSHTGCIDYLRKKIFFYK